MTTKEANERRDVARDLCSFIDASPSPYHACEEAARRLAEAGYQELAETDPWDSASGSYFVRRGGALVAWSHGAGEHLEAGFRIVAAHTDSPNLRVKPRPDTGSAGYRQLSIEVYGGVLLNSWLDRDLGLSGRVLLRPGATASGEAVTRTREASGGAIEVLFRIDRPILRVPQLAIHLDREIHEKGLRLNKQLHMRPVWGLDGETEATFVDLLAQELGVGADEVMSWDAMTHDTNHACLSGWHEEFVSAPRLDNLCSCHAAVCALVEEELPLVRPVVPVICLFDHEEVGSVSRAGADSTLLSDVLERSVLARGGDREDLHRALAASLCVSADMAHATHPNYAERHDPGHQLKMNAGPVIKINSNQRYATEAETAAHFELCCLAAEVPFQKWANRADLACGSTIGPITAGRLGIRTVDVGNPQLGMHSAREMCGSEDSAYLVGALRAFQAGP
jgi:aspartyl aminopeptidase